MTSDRHRFEITVENRQKRIRILRPRLLRRVREVLARLGWKRAGLSLLLVDDAEIRRLHRRFLGQDRATDVLAFGQQEGKPFPGRGTPFLGDVVVSVETARRAGPEYGNRWDEELLLYLCHGILHLMGWQDSTPAQRARMDRKQQNLLRKVLGARWRSKNRKLLF
ncbi:MAG: rRNA maturation RNase YbeY [Candidatus Omnitrophica bacterium]|nr:rRNA maturation RNase YbeY [Candidatus Omnitrophota bacterium]